eukprot:COSAG01_NODE_35566_length_530_cov_0.832947_1_plen_22_part_10
MAKEMCASYAGVTVLESTTVVS